MRIFKINKEELFVGLVALLMFVALNALMVEYHFDLFTKHLKGGYWTLFSKHFCISGFDCITYVAISKWRMMYSLYRHPLLGVALYPLAQLNQWLMSVTDMNCAIFIVAFILVVLDFYSFLFIYRIFRNVMSMNQIDSILLSTLLFSFASIMLTMFVPDHFGISFFILSLTLYMSGMRMKIGKTIGRIQTALLFFFSMGVTLTNGIKVIMSAILVNGRKCLRPMWMFIAVVMPAALMLSLYILQENTIMEDERHFVEKMERATKKRAEKEAYFKKKVIETENIRKKVADRKKGQLIDNQFFDFTDTRIPKLRTLTENVFGESIQLHQEHLLEDVYHTRPLFVPYSNMMNYIVELVIICLFLIGLWIGRQDRFLWISASWFAFDMFLHVVLSFAIADVYIMGAHWMFVIPVAIACLLRSVEGHLKFTLRAILMFLCIYLIVYNGSLIFKYMTA